MATKDEDEVKQDQIKQAVADAMREVLADPEVLEAFWLSAFSQLRQQAQTQTGRFLLGSLGALLSRIGLFLALGFVVYWLGGWAAVAKLWQVLSGSGT